MNIDAIVQRLGFPPKQSFGPVTLSGELLSFRAPLGDVFMEDFAAVLNLRIPYGQVEFSFWCPAKWAFDSVVAWEQKRAIGARTDAEWQLQVSDCVWGVTLGPIATIPLELWEIIRDQLSALSSLFLAWGGQERVLDLEYEARCSSSRNRSLFELMLRGVPRAAWKDAR